MGSRQHYAIEALIRAPEGDLDGVPSGAFSSRATSTGEATRSFMITIYLDYLREHK
jgi:hypothetical protein